MSAGQSGSRECCLSSSLGAVREPCYRRACLTASLLLIVGASTIKNSYLRKPSASTVVVRTLSGPSFSRMETAK